MHRAWRRIYLASTGTPLALGMEEAPPGFISCKCSSKMGRLKGLIGPSAGNPGGRSAIQCKSSLTRG